MRCQRCETALERPGDHCLVCGASPTEAVIVALEAGRATLWMMDGEDVLGESAITTTPEASDPGREVQRRNFIARIVAEIRRKRPEAVYVTGPRSLVRRLRRSLETDVYRIDDEDPVASYRERVADPPLTVVELAPEEKLGGRHSTVIGDRRGRRVLRTVAEHPHVKKIVPGPIEGGGSGSRAGFRARVTRAGRRGNLRVLLHDGSTVQEVRVVTTAGDRADGERIAEQLNGALRDAELHG